MRKDLLLTETEIFISGWQACRSRLINLIETYSSGWLPNGPSKATADAIIKQIKAIPTPRAENIPYTDPNAPTSR